MKPGSFKNVANNLFAYKSYKIYYVVWGHILPYPKDGLVQSKHILRASSLGENNFLFLTRHLTDCKPKTASTSFVWLPFFC